MGPAIFVVGLVISLIGWVMVIWLAFRESVLWGLACLFIPFAYFIFAITHWADAKKGFLTGVAGTALFFFGLAVTPAPTKQVPQPAQEQASMIPAATTTHATFEQVTAHAPEPAPAPVVQEEPVQPVFAQVWADNRTKLFYPRDCATRPEHAYLLSKSVATSQGYKAAPCK